MAESRYWHPFADMGAVKDREVVIERGEDVWVWDDLGNRYFDATASLWYSNIGHGRHEIADAVAAQLKKIEAYSNFGDFATAPTVELAQALTDRAPMPSRLFLTSGGGDSIDVAVKIARRYFFELGAPERTLLVSRTQGYHGTHGYGTAIGGIPANRVGFGPQVESEQVAHDSVEALEETIRRVGAERIAAFFVEPVIGAGGVYPPGYRYIEGVAALCKQNGILFVCDSVICGFGRLGSWYGIERFDVIPDMITFAKGVTSGYLPLGGVIIADTVAEPFFGDPGSPILRHGATYAGHATCAAAALANIKILEDEGLIPRGAEMEKPLFEALNSLAGHPATGEVRGGTGMLAALDLDSELLARDPAALGRLTATARKSGVILRQIASGVAVSPPLTSTAEHFELITEAVSAGLDAAAA
ncbi:MAG TPA: aminotransferase class III-fold pyridoxal phosphate-dependent enzyme [Solirubrobacteraceae bacterium]|jgi:adenosylmethionine-8-amino-7-oxononanoate aminotransferase|nr:aminotransferase class III-fold pyridoxal phosphate-dependent enzyme [Solirubrobacteraceae bacterium]